MCPRYNATDCIDLKSASIKIKHDPHHVQQKKWSALILERSRFKGYFAFIRSIGNNIKKVASVRVQERVDQHLKPAFFVTRLFEVMFLERYAPFPGLAIAEYLAPFSDLSRIETFLAEL